jgi:hypothetical protein
MGPFLSSPILWYTKVDYVTLESYIQEEKPNVYNRITKLIEADIYS